MTVPSATPDLENDTPPVGSELPDAAFTVTFTEVVPPVAIVAGLAVTVRVVAIAGADTVTVTGADVEDANAAEPA